MLPGESIHMICKLLWAYRKYDSCEIIAFCKAFLLFMSYSLPSFCVQISPCCGISILIPHGNNIPSPHRIPSPLGVNFPTLYSELYSLEALLSFICMNTVHCLWTVICTWDIQPRLGWLFQGRKFGEQIRFDRATGKSMTFCREMRGKTCRWWAKIHIFDRDL